MSKVLIITGVSGIASTVIENMYLELQNYNIVIACRNINHGLLLKNEILLKHKDNKNNNQLHVLELDLANFDSVNNFINKFQNEFNQLNVLLLNASVGKNFFIVNNKDADAPLTKDGYELSMQVNFLANAYLVVKLSPLLISSAKKESVSRIIHISSATHDPESDSVKKATEYVAKAKDGTSIKPCINLNNEKILLSNGKFNIDLGLGSHYHGFRSYTSSKLAMMMFLNEFLASQKNNENLSIISVNPGTVLEGSNFNSGATTSWIMKFIFWLYKVLVKYKILGQSGSDHPVTPISEVSERYISAIVDPKYIGFHKLQYFSKYPDGPKEYGPYHHAKLISDKDATKKLSDLLFQQPFFST